MKAFVNSKLLVCILVGGAHSWINNVPISSQIRNQGMPLAINGRFTAIQHIEDIINDFDYWIIDQWGVLHNGETPYKNVVNCLSRMKDAGKCLILLSNSSKRKESSFKGLKHVGIDPTLFDDIVTSGEIGHAAISQLNSQFGKKLFVVGNNYDDQSYVESAGCSVTSVSDATGVLVRGTFSILDGTNHYAFTTASSLMENVNPWLESCMGRNLPMLVTNPDFSRPGTNDPMPGLIGAKYEELGGSVSYIGKPYSDVYDECVNVIRRHANSCDRSCEEFQSRVCCVGDSLEHDVRGAEKHGFASLWTSNGVHCVDIGLDPLTSEGSETTVEITTLKNVIDMFGVSPTYVIPCFTW